MEDKIEVGEFVRTNKGNIGQVIDIFQGHCVAKYHIEFKGNVKVKRQYLSTNTIVNHNKIISEIIEVGDYVNGKLIHKIEKGPNYCYLYYGNCKTFVDYQIKTIVTHEQFASIEYKLEEEN